MKKKQLSNLKAVFFVFIFDIFVSFLYIFSKLTFKMLKIKEFQDDEYIFSNFVTNKKVIVQKF